MPETFKAYRVKEEQASYSAALETLDMASLPQAEVCVKVAYSSLNYKDALSATGNKGVSKHYPHTPGIDAAGVVVSSENDRFREGDKVIVTSYDLGMNTAGGFAEYIRVPADWIVPLPTGLSLYKAMVFGTAGLAAGLSIDRLLNCGLAEGPVVVTGASGGVGSIATALLAHLGYEVIASTGSEQARSMLKGLGAQTCIPREDLAKPDPRPMAKASYAGAIDTVGGHTLENLIKRLKPHASVAACGLVSGVTLALSVFPFILRGVNLLGIDTQSYPLLKRQELWKTLATTWNIDLTPIVTEIGLSDLNIYIQKMLKGETQGRILLCIDANLD